MSSGALAKEENKNMFYVYIIQSIKFPNQFYTGFSSNLKERIKEHNKGSSPHTGKFKPWKLIFYSAFENKKLALDFEKYLKSGSGVAFKNKRLIVGENPYQNNWYDLEAKKLIDYAKIDLDKYNYKY